MININKYKPTCVDVTHNIKVKIQIGVYCMIVMSKTSCKITSFLLLLFFICHSTENNTNK